MSIAAEQITERAKDIQSEKHSVIAPEGRTPFHVLGHENKGAGETVLFQVFVNCEVGKPDRKASQALPLHEIPLMRALQRKSGGTVEIVATWPNPVHVPQQRALTRALAMDLATRLRGQDDPTLGPTMRGAFVFVQDDGMERNCFTEVYGGENGTKHRLFEAIRDSHKAWMERVTAARDAMRRITVEDLEECVAACLPRSEVDELDAITLDANALASATGGPSAEGAGEFAEYLIEVGGVNDDVARAFAAACAQPAITPGELTEEQWETVPGLAKEAPGAAKKRKALLTKLGEFKKLGG